MGNIELRKRWIEALRSGKYERSTSMLRHKSYGFCCLGVLCDISNLGNWELQENSDHYRYVIDEQRHSSFLPEQIVNRIGTSGTVDFSFEVEKISNETTRKEIRVTSGAINLCSLSMLNDHGFTFEQIADLIENEPQAFFLGEE